MEVQHVPNTPAEVVIACAKCGKPMDFPAGFVIPPGVALAHREGECPQRHYRLRVTIERFESEPRETETGEPMAWFGATVPGDSFMEVLPAVQIELNRKWETLIESAGIVESDERPLEAPEASANDGDDVAVPE